MCTVSHVPRPHGFLLVCNRDERRSRVEATPPRWEVVEGRRLCAPRDPQGGGSWIAVRDDGVALCLLNGARGEAVRSRDDAPSRGLLLLELVRTCSSADIGLALRNRAAKSPLRENPFRLMVAAPGSLEVWEWNGRALRSASVDPVHLEVSHGLDPVGGWHARRRSFVEHFPTATSEESELCSWHASHFIGDRADQSPCMHHELAVTVSQTVVEVDAGSVTLSYRPGAPCSRPEPDVHTTARVP